MKFVASLRLVVLGAALWAGPMAAPAALAAPADKVPAASADPDKLVDVLFAKLNIPKLTGDVITASKAVIVVMLKQAGPTDEQAAEIWDLYLEPAFKSRTPELVQSLRAIVLTDFTTPELQAIVGQQQNAARQSAAAKVPQMQQQFQQAGQQWGQRVATEAFAANKDAIEKLGVREGPAQ